MHMKLDRLSRELEVKFTRQDASNMRKASMTFIYTSIRSSDSDSVVMDGFVWYPPGLANQRSESEGQQSSPGVLRGR